MTTSEMIPAHEFIFQKSFDWKLNCTRHTFLWAYGNGDKNGIMLAKEILRSGLLTLQAPDTILNMLSEAVDRMPDSQIKEFAEFVEKEKDNGLELEDHGPPELNPTFDGEATAWRKRRYFKNGVEVDPHTFNPYEFRQEFLQRFPEFKDENDE